MRTIPVNHSGLPFADGCDPARLMSMVFAPDWVQYSQNLLEEFSTLSAVFTCRVSADTLDAFASDDRNHSECSYGVRPPPPERRIEHQATEENGREIGAERCLFRLGRERATPELEGDLALGARENW